MNLEQVKWQLPKLRWHTPGRQRWDIQCIYRNPDLAEQVEQRVCSHSGIISCKANAVTGRVLVIFEQPAFCQIADIKNLLIQVLNKLLNGVDDLALVEDNYSESVLAEVIRYGHDSPKQRRKCVALSVCNSTFKVITPLTVGCIVTVAVTGALAPLAALGLQSASSQIFGLGGFFITTKIAEAVTGHKKQQAWTEYAQTIEKKLRVKSIEKIHSLDTADLENYDSEKLINLVIRDTEKIKQFMLYAPPTLLEKSMTILTGIGILLMISSGAFILSALPIPALIYINKKQRKRMEQEYRKNAPHMEYYHQLLANNVNGISTIRSFSNEEREIQGLQRAGERYYRHDERKTAINSYYNNNRELALGLGMMLPLAYSSLGLLQGSISVLQLTIQAIATGHLLHSSTGMEQSFSVYFEARDAALRLNNLLTINAKIQAGKLEMSKKQCKGSLTFEHISFSYPHRPIFENIHFEIASNKTIGITGITGSGKSTLVKLMQRLYDVDSGRITIDGIDIKDLHLKSLRDAISLVGQDTFLFNDTLRANLIYGAPNATEQEIEAALEVASATEFINRFPQGLNTIVGERGQKLSGGQRQRISIARAVLKNSPILILDEATASVDNQTEALIRRSLERLAHSRTIIIIAHRLSTISNADCIYLLKDSAISEVGTHEQLLACDGDYRVLWQLQTREEKTTEVQLPCKEKNTSCTNY